MFSELNQKLQYMVNTQLFEVQNTDNIDRLARLNGKSEEQEEQELDEEIENAKNKIDEKYMHF